jgi:hypothetical protein
VHQRALRGSAKTFSMTFIPVAMKLSYASRRNENWPIAHPLLRSTKSPTLGSNAPVRSSTRGAQLANIPTQPRLDCGVHEKPRRLDYGDDFATPTPRECVPGLMKLMLIASKMPQSPAGEALVIHRRAGAVGLLAQAASRSDGRPSDRRITALCFRRRLSCGGRSNMSLQHAACPTDPICLYRCR